jgi:hypothetical protein
MGAAGIGAGLSPARIMVRTLAEGSNPEPGNHAVICSYAQILQFADAAPFYSNLLSA